MRIGFGLSALTWTSLILANALIGCDPADQAVPSQAPAQEPGGDALTPDQNSAYVSQVMELKSQVEDPARLESELARLQSRFGIRSGSAFGASVGRTGATGPGATLALPKAAASGDEIRYEFYTAKSGEITFPYAMVKTLTVQNGAQMTVVTDRSSAGTDPYMMAFYSEFGDPDRVGVIRIIGLDDDGAGNLNSKIVWKNATGAAQKVKVIVFAYNSSSTGPCRLEYRNSAAAIPIVISGTLRATRDFATAANPGACNLGPMDTRITLKRISGGGYIGYGTGLLGVNVTTRNGLHVYNKDASADFGLGWDTNQALKPDGRNFILPYLENLDGYGYPNGNSWGITQTDKYMCP